MSKPAMPAPTAAELTALLALLPHPEGGYYRETYRAADSIAADALPAAAGFTGPRSICTAIYYLLEAGDFSAFHRIRSDEAWHFYAGGPLEIVQLSPQGELRVERLGLDPASDALPQRVVPAGWWFASRPAAGTAFALVGCTVAPGFDFADFEMADPAALLAEYPAHRAWIEALTR